MSKISEKIEKLREQHNLSMRQFAHRIGMTDSGYGIMIKKNTVKVDTLEKISQAFNVQMAYFFEDYHEKKSEGSGEYIDQLLARIEDLKHRSEFLEAIVIDKLGKVEVSGFAAA